MYDERGLGITPATVLTPVIGGLFASNKDPNRIATNTAAYNSAVSGHDGPFEGYSSGLEFLRAHTVPGSWATSVAVNDAVTKYQKALAIINAQAGKPAGAPVQDGGVTIIPSTVGGLATTPLLIAGAALVGIVVLSKRGRR